MVSWTTDRELYRREQQQPLAFCLKIQHVSEILREVRQVVHSLDGYQEKKYILMFLNVRKRQG